MMDAIAMQGHYAVSLGSDRWIGSLDTEARNAVVRSSEEAYLWPEAEVEDAQALAVANNGKIVRIDVLVANKGGGIPFAGITTEQLEREAAERLAEVQRRKDTARAEAVLGTITRSEGEVRVILVEGGDHAKFGDDWHVSIDANTPGIDLEAFFKVVRMEATRQLLVLKGLS